MRNRFTRLVCGRWAAGLLCLLCLGPVLAAGPVSGQPEARALLAEFLQDMKRNSPEWKALLADGKARAEFCANCHGEDGNSKVALVPNLAGQNPYYLLDQIEKFADGRRKDYIMSPLARQFTRDDKLAVVLYYTSMVPRPQLSEAGRTAKGGELYGQRCYACHGQGAHGSDQFARLASQQPAYLQRRLRGFAEGNGGAVSPMVDIAKGLRPEQVEQLTAYLASLP